ncbi:hypothetical protein GQ600_7827 [Phytophthora cactorum]|nr:hypothetical protein GQ600_7827 [Phytophthora cactorum]
MEAGIAVTTEEEVCAVRSVLRLRLKRDLQVSPALTADNGSKAAADGSWQRRRSWNSFLSAPCSLVRTSRGCCLGQWAAIDGSS